MENEWRLAFPIHNSEGVFFWAGQGTQILHLDYDKISILEGDLILNSPRIPRRNIFYYNTIFLPYNNLQEISIQPGKEIKITIKDISKLKILVRNRLWRSIIES